MAKASAGEIRAQLYIAKDQNYITEEEFESIKYKTEEVSKTISGFVTYLRNQKAITVQRKLSKL
jgi:four helix bundle protein